MFQEIQVEHYIVTNKRKSLLRVGFIEVDIILFSIADIITVSHCYTLNEFSFVL